MRKGTKVIHEPKCNMYDIIFGEVLDVRENFVVVQYEQNGRLIIQNFNFNEVRQYEN